MANQHFSYVDPNGFFHISGTIFGGKKPHISVSGIFDTPLAGLNATKLKGDFKIDRGDKLNPLDDTVTSFTISDFKHHKLLSYSGFSDPKAVSDIVVGLPAAFAGPGDIYEKLFLFWNGLVDGDFTARIATGKGSLTQVGTGGTATIFGGKGADIVDVFQSKSVVFNGGKGSDTLYLDAHSGIPIPVVNATIDLTQASNVNPFGGTFTLTSVENIFGTQGNDDLRGNAANNILDAGWGGSDSLRGAAGNDTLIFIRANTVAVADGGEGTDTLQVDVTESSSVLDLTNQANNAGVFAGSTVSNIEIFRFDEFTATAASGIEFHGSEIGETVFGGMASDNLFGGGGNDVLIGGVNSGQSPSFRDEMTGGTGADRFVFRNSLDSSSGGSYDIIHDFSHAEHDKIDLHGIDANLAKKGNQDFHFIGEKAFSGKLGELQIFVDSGNTFVVGNLTGTTAPDFIVRVDDVTNLVKGDFIL